MNKVKQLLMIIIAAIVLLALWNEYNKGNETSFNVTDTLNDVTGRNNPINYDGGLTEMPEKVNITIEDTPVQPVQPVQPVLAVTVVFENPAPNIDGCNNTQIDSQRVGTACSGSVRSFDNTHGMAYNMTGQKIYFNEPFDKIAHNCIRVGEYQLLQCENMTDNNNDGWLDQ